jgi:ElaB/YqjD/DUF883 family membrane-anchored ribosome-binding protein
MFSKRTEKDYDALKNEISHLFDDLSGIAKTVTDLGKKEAGEARKVVEKEVEKKLGDLRAKLEGFREQGKEAFSGIEKQVTENPWASIAAAVGVGYIIGKLLNRK